MHAATFNKLQVEARAVRPKLRALGVNTLLAEPDANPKIKKSLGQGVFTAPLHLAPALLSGFNVCPMATAGCIKACLHTAGNPAYMPMKTKARIARTKAYFNARADFMVALAFEIAKHERAARKARMLCGVRLNATSDIPWEKVPVTIAGKAFPSLMAAFPRITFYDYTKRHNRKNLPSNYSLTFSLAENNDAAAIEANRNGMNIAAVFNVKRGHPLPENFLLQVDGMAHVLPVIDGDEHDFRPIDPKGVIVGLRAKGKAIYDNTGFVRRVI